MPLLAKDVDLIAYGSEGQPLLLVEVKGQRQTSATWAARFRQNLMEAGALPRAPFFMIATPERMYFWRRDERDQASREPQFSVDAVSELTPYFEKLRQSPEKVSRSALQLILFTWLVDLSQPSGQARARQDPLLQWLSSSGLLDALGGARIESGAYG